MIKTYNGKSALITGGSSGTGLAMAKQLAEAGANVTIVARDPIRLDAACRQISAARVSEKQRVQALSVDITDAESVQHCLSYLEPPDFLFNIAGRAHPGLFHKIDVDIFRWMMDVNYFGNLYVTRTFLPAMIERRSGHIVNVSSITGFHGVYGYSAYAPAKFALRGLSDVQRAELAEFNIRVSLVFPPDMDTPAVEYEKPLKPNVLKFVEKMNTPMKPEVVARVILRDVARGVYLITPGFDSTLYFHLNNLLGPLAYRVMDLVLTLARNNTNRNGKHQGPE